MFICVQDFSEYSNFEECVAYIEDYMVKNGPFDGLLGFSQVRLEYITKFLLASFSSHFDYILDLTQGAILAAALPGMQAEVLRNPSYLVLSTF